MVKESSDINRLVWPEDSKALTWLDRIEKIKNTALTAGVGYLGFKTFNSPAGALYGLLALRLAENTGGAGVMPNVSRVAGLGMLAFLGAMAIPTVTGPPGTNLPHEQTVRDVDTGQMVKFELTQTDAGWQYVRAEGEPAPVVGPRMEYQPGAQVGQYIPTDNPYI